MRSVLRRTEAIYHHQECSCELCATAQVEIVEAIDIGGWLKVMEQLAQDVYEGKTDSKSIDPAYIAAMYDELNTAAGKGYGKDWIKVNKSTGNLAPEVIQMQRNLYKFSGAKTTTVLEEINQILHKQLPWKEFKAEVLKLNPKYNKNYLQAEWQTANQSAKHARDWEYYKANASLYPNLAYRTQGDERVRDAHTLLNGVVAAIGSDFWKTHYPPNGWRCRCYVVQTAETPTQEDKIPKLNDKDFPEEFRINTGESGQVFSEGNLKDSKAHPYFALTRNEDWEKAFELSKLSAPANLVYTANNGSTIKTSPFADDNDYANNLSLSKKITDNLPDSVEIRAHINLSGYKNPELKIEDIIGDGTHREGNVKNFIANSFNNKLKTGGQLADLEKTFIAMDFKEYDALSNKDYKSIVGSLLNKMNSYKSVDFVILAFNDKALKVYNKDIPDDFTKGFQYLYEKLEPMRNTKGSK